MPLSLICASHSPLLHRVTVDEQVSSDVQRAFGELAEHIRAFRPDFAIQFSPDHYQGFFHRLMPSFCIGLAARSAADWDIMPGALDVPRPEAALLAQWLIDADFDVAVSRDMVVDHGFLQVWQETLGGFASVPLIPIFLNCAAPPLPAYKRIRQIGLEVGNFARQTGKRVLIVASGGLSHDPPLPDIDAVPDEVRARLMHGTVRTADEKRAHEDHLAQFGRLAGKGEGPCRPLNPEWDHEFLEIVKGGRLAEFDDRNAQQVAETAGRAANEVLAWIAASSAMSAAGAYHMDVKYYRPIPEWIAGMALATASTR